MGIIRTSIAATTLFCFLIDLVLFAPVQTKLSKIVLAERLEVFSKFLLVR
jgi:hypothetical protein